MGRPEHLGPMARTLVETFAELTLPQQRRVFAMLQEIMETNERGAAAMAALGEIGGESYGVGETRPSAALYNRDWPDNRERQAPVEEGQADVE